MDGRSDMVFLHTVLLFLVRPLDPARGLTFSIFSILNAAFNKEIKIILIKHGL